MSKSNAAEERTGPKKFGKHERTLLLRKLLSLSEVFMGCLLFLFLFLFLTPSEKWKQQQSRLSGEMLAPSQKAEIFLKRSKLGKFSIFIVRKWWVWLWKAISSIMLKEEQHELLFICFEKGLEQTAKGPIIDCFSVLFFFSFLFLWSPK